MKEWILLIISLPTQNATARMRAWRALKACGAAVLRDGVYLLPERPPCRLTLEAVAADVRVTGGLAYLLQVGETEASEFLHLFERNKEFGELLADVSQCRNSLTTANAADALKLVRRFRKTFAAIAEIDFFPSEAGAQAESALEELEGLVNRMLSPDEPHAASSAITPLDPVAYRGRLWATRRRPWVDRLASAWLICRFIDPQARFVWLASPADCPADALGFDFDGAAFSHVGAKVTFETLLASFRLEQAALNRIGALVHYLDVGGVQPLEAVGVERVLMGMRESMTDDDQLLAAACAVFDSLLAAFKKEAIEQ
jgi:hypothetical protein